MSTNWNEVGELNHPGVTILRHDSNHPDKVRAFTEHGVEWHIAGRFRKSRAHRHRIGALEAWISEADCTWRLCRWTRRTKRGGREVSVIEWLNDPVPAHSLSEARRLGLEALRGTLS